MQLEPDYAEIMLTVFLFVCEDLQYEKHGFTVPAMVR
jgi:hypothetical protein